MQRRVVPTKPQLPALSLLWELGWGLVAAAPALGWAVPMQRTPGAEQSLVLLPLPSRHVASGAVGSLPAPSTRCLQPPVAEVLPVPSTVLLAGLARERGVESGDGAEAIAESEESEAVEDASRPRLQVSEQKSRPRREVRGCPCSGFRQRLQQKQAARACQCSPWWVASSLSTPEGQPWVRGRLFPSPCAKTHPPHRATGLWLRSPPSPHPACPGREVLLRPAPERGGQGPYRWGPRRPGTARRRGSRSSRGSRAGRSSSRSAARAGACHTPGSRSAPGASAGPPLRCTPP